MDNSVIIKEANKNGLTFEYDICVIIDLGQAINFSIGEFGVLFLGRIVRPNLHHQSTCFPK